MSKKLPLVVQYVENKKDHSRLGKVFYIKDKKKEKFLSELKASVKNLEDLKDEELFRNNFNSFIDKYSQKIKSWYFIEGGRGFFKNKKYRELDFNPKYRELVINQEKKTNGEIIIVDFTGSSNFFNSRFARVTTQDLDIRDKELIREVKEDRIEVQKSNKDEIIMLDYNTTDLFTKVFIRDKEGNKRYDQEHSRYWREKLNKINKIKRIKTHGADKYIYQDFTKKFFKKNIPSVVSEIWLSGKFKGDLSKIDEKDLTDYLTKHYYKTLICGNIDLNDYPNQKITVYHALDIDCDLLNIFNIHIKDLEPHSFQFIDINYSNDNDIDKIQLEGPIKHNYCKIPCEK